MSPGVYYFSKFIRLLLPLLRVRKNCRVKLQVERSERLKVISSTRRIPREWKNMDEVGSIPRSGEREGDGKGKRKGRTVWKATGKEGGADKTGIRCEALVNLWPEVVRARRGKDTHPFREDRPSGETKGGLLTINQCVGVTHTSLVPPLIIYMHVDE